MLQEILQSLTPTRGESPVTCLRMPPLFPQGPHEELKASRTVAVAYSFYMSSEIVLEGARPCFSLKHHTEVSVVLGIIPTCSPHDPGIQSLSDRVWKEEVQGQASEDTQESSWVCDVSRDHCIVALASRWGQAWGPSSFWL